ncbi:MAG: hypothetical protein HY722_11650, partial [Planctomycetes bacterium]|nr:hypothetical protein [Planctomycetota bacterium]
MDVDLERIKALIDLMNANNLLEMELEEEGRKVRLKKAGEVVYREDQRLGGGWVAPPEVPPAPATAASGSAAPAGAPLPSGNGAVARLTIKSPMVGTFYRAPSPDADPFVAEGDRVQPDTTLCIIEAMKVMN